MLEITLDIIKNCVSEFTSNKNTYEIYERYFKGDHDINYKYKMQDARSNLKVVKNYPRRFIKEEVSYVLSNPVNYISKTGDKESINLIDLNFGVWEKTHNQNLLEEALKYNEAYELCYTTTDGEFKCSILTPLNGYILTDDTIEKNIVMAIHFYTKKIDNGVFNVSGTDKKAVSNQYIDVYIDNKVTTYNITKGYEKIAEKEINFDYVPVNLLKINEDGQSPIEDYKKLNDGYNNVLSDLVNEVSDIRNSILEIRGVKITLDQVTELIKKGVINNPNPNGKIGWIPKEINDQFVQNLLNKLDNDIHMMASHVDENEKLQSNVSSPTLRARLISLEHKCSTMANRMELLVKHRLKMFFDYQFKLTGEKYDYRTITVKFTPNVPQDLAGIADACSKLDGIVSKHTLRSQISFVESPDLEEKYIKDEIGSELSPEQVKKMIEDNLKGSGNNE